MNTTPVDNIFYLGICKQFLLCQYCVKANADLLENDKYLRNALSETEQAKVEKSLSNASEEDPK